MAESQDIPIVLHHVFVKDALSSMRQYLATEIPLKMMKNFSNPF